MKHAHNPALQIKSQRHCCLFDLWSPQTSAHVHMQHLPPHSRLGAWVRSWRSPRPFKKVATRPSKHTRRRRRSVEDPSHWFPLFCCLHVLMLELGVFWSSDGGKHFSLCSVGNGFIVSHHEWIVEKWCQFSQKPWIYSTYSLVGGTFLYSQNTLQKNMKHITFNGSSTWFKINLKYRLIMHSVCKNASIKIYNT